MGLYCLLRPFCAKTWDLQGISTEHIMQFVNEEQTRKILSQTEFTYELCHEKICFLDRCKISCAVTTQLISAFVLATKTVQSLSFLNPKFQASSQLLWLYSPVCVGPGRKPRRQIFSQCASFHQHINKEIS